MLTSLEKGMLVRAALVLAMLVPHAWAVAETLVIPGSGSPEHVLKVLAEAFNRAQSAHQVNVPPSIGTAGALRDVESGAAILGRVGRPLKADERAKGLVYLPIGRDPVVFVGGAGVTVKSMSQAQIVDAYNGKLTNWRELGGKPGPIRAIGRESTDASRQSINRVIKPFDGIRYGDDVKLVHLDPQMIELLDRYATGLGFINRSALAACKTTVVPIALDGVDGLPQNVALGRYPLWLEFGLIHKSGPLSPAARAFVAFTRSSLGLGLLREHGVMAVADPL